MSDNMRELAKKILMWCRDAPLGTIQEEALRQIEVLLREAMAERKVSQAGTSTGVGNQTILDVWVEAKVKEARSAAFFEAAEIADAIWGENINCDEEAALLLEQVITKLRQKAGGGE